ncbi:MAG: hypothetical protein ND807_10430 [Vicinamibacterales bacterium]|nr:hypothetical protein [Vicinamibacterales bacterium]
MIPTLKYCATAAALGIGWFLVLLLPSMSREWLLADIGPNLACLVAASVIVAVGFRRYIGSAETIGSHLVRAIALPYVGCFVFLSLWAALMWTRSLLRGGLANLHDTLSLYVMGLMATALSFYIVIPYGWLCQYVMTTVANAEDA